MTEDTGALYFALVIAPHSGEESPPLSSEDHNFGGHRETVLTWDGNRCTVPGCTTLKRGKRSIAVHHRKPGNSDPKLMITLCLACHAKVTRTLYLQREWPPLKRLLRKEQVEHQGGARPLASIGHNSGKKERSSKTPIVPLPCRASVTRPLTLPMVCVAVCTDRYV
jgi:hypothetical protein